MSHAKVTVKFLLTSLKSF